MPVEILKRFEKTHPVLESKKNREMTEQDNQDIFRIKALTGKPLDVCKNVWYRTSTTKEALECIVKYFWLYSR